MALAKQEIKSRAAAFIKTWEGTTSEDAEAKAFLIEFFNIFGIARKEVAYFEQRVKKIDKSSGKIDLLWPGKLLVEMKSKGEDLNKAYKQALEYCDGLQQNEIPSIILVCDFQNFHVYQDGHILRFEIKELIQNLEAFDEIAGYQKNTYHEQDPVNIEAAELMGKLHDEMKDAGYTGTQLEAYLVRLLFIMFADDTEIFRKGIFLDYIIQRTGEDGSDLGMHLDQLFQVLDTPEDKRLKTLDEQLNLFPYVNGKLFSERLATASFNSKMRKALLECCKLDWSKISPAIFGSLFQSVMDSKERRNLGAHYTSEKNILKVIKPLFLDALQLELSSCGENINKLKSFHSKLSKLRFLDPACGCGNFLITAYRELKYLEISVVEKLLKGQSVTNINHYFLVDLNQFYGIEYSEFPSQIAQVAMWLIDHQINMSITVKFGQYIPSIPLAKSATIIHDNALRLDWHSIIKRKNDESNNIRFDYIFGNPPYVGFKLQNENQKKDLSYVFNNSKSVGVLDYISGWFEKTASYINTYGTTSRVHAAFVSTNSICQGEQVQPLWARLSILYKTKIHFAHQTFKWSNESKGKASVFCVIVGFSNYTTKDLALYEYENVDSDPTLNKNANNINAYLVSGPDVFLTKRSKPLCNVPTMTLANLAYDFGYLTFSKEEKQEFIEKEPNAESLFKPVVSAYEFLNNKERWCLWLKDVDTAILKKLPSVIERLKLIKAERLKSTRPQTVKAAETPGLFAEIRQPENNFLAFPITSSENRKYIPIGFFTPEYITSAGIHVIPNASLYEFGVLMSYMHITWTRYTCGRMKSDFRYSNTLTYNNFPWPTNPSDTQKNKIIDASKEILEIRSSLSNQSLADLYDPYSPSVELYKAHQKLDKVVDLCYRSQPFTSEAKRIEYLFELYEKYTGGLFQPEKKSKKRQTQQ